MACLEINPTYIRLRMGIGEEIYFSVDIETSGPIPGEFSMLTLGACVVDKMDQTFAMTLRPDSMRVDEEALKVTGLSIENLLVEGENVETAMQSFRDWVTSCSGQRRPVFIGLNAAFDWSFVNYYFHKYCGGNPFGFAALDIKSLFMGHANVEWSQTKASQIAKMYGAQRCNTHNALKDALFQAELFNLIRRDADKFHAAAVVNRKE